MKTIDFYPKEFSKVPAHDNPAFNGEECYMIVADEDSRLKKPHAVVLLISPDPIDSVTNIAKFWRHENAVKYCGII